MKLNILNSAIFFQLFTFGINTHADVVEFHITAGTAEKAWNAEVTSIKGKLGDTIHFVNDDSVVHRLHTYGSPCDHGPDFQPGGTWDCVTTSAYNAGTDGPLYDHNFGESAEVWFNISVK